jgi:hypothetical protein
VFEHSVANLSWAVLRGALGPSDGSAGAASNVPSALGVLRHPDIYAGVPEEIEEAFAVLEQHAVREGVVYPVAVAVMPFLFDILRRKASSIVAPRIADVIARYVAASRSSGVDANLTENLLTQVTDQSGEVIRWFGRYDRALAALAVHVPALRELYIAAVEGAEQVAPEALLALVELGVAPGETVELALALLDGADAIDITRTAAAAFLAKFAKQSPELAVRLDAVLPPSAPGALRNFLIGLWSPSIVRPVVAPKLFDAEVVFTGKKLVLVKAGSRSVTLPWEGADLPRGAHLQVGLTIHGEPKLALVTDWKGNVRVIDFAP